MERDRINDTGDKALEKEMIILMMGGENMTLRK